MRLAELRVREPVEFPGVGNTSHMREAAGFALDLEGGLVTVIKQGATRMIPLSNVAWMAPAPPTGKK